MSEAAPNTPVLAGLDARVKLICAVVLVAVLFVGSTLASVALVAGVVAVLLVVAQVDRARVGAVLQPLSLLFVSMVVIQSMLVGSADLQLGPVSLSAEGVERGLFLSLRIATVVLLSFIVTHTASPAQLCAAIEWLAAPLRPLGVPVGDLAVTATLALAFIPTLATELDELERAQRARGLEPQGQSLLGRLRLRAALLAPLCTRAFRWSHQLADAMYLRGYRSGVRRAYLRPHRFGAAEAAALAATGLVAAAVLAVSDLW